MTCSDKKTTASVQDGQKKSKAATLGHRLPAGKVFRLIVDCQSEQQQRRIYQLIKQEEVSCRVLTLLYDRP